MSNEKAIELVDQILQSGGEHNVYLRRAIMKMRNRLQQRPMSEILALMGKEQTVGERAKQLGVSRQAIYSWMNGRTRPTGKAVVRKLAKITGVTEAEIRGK